MFLIKKNVQQNESLSARLRTLKLLFVLIALTFSVQGSAQKTDSLFNIARQLAFNGRYDTAILVLDKVCSQEPRNTDFRLFRGRVYAWNHDYKNSENDILNVLSQQPRNREAMATLADVYLWSKNWIALESLTQNALKVPPASSAMAQLEGGNAVMDSAIFIKKYALGLAEQNKLKEALSALTPIKSAEPQLYDNIVLRLKHHQIGWHGSYYHYTNSNLQDWKLTDLEYTYKSKPVTVVATANFASRFGNQGVQYMLQAYPKIGKRAYAWLIAGFSNGKAFPDRAYGASFFLNVAKGWETELGMRLFQVFKNDEVATVLKGGLAKQWSKHRIHYGVSRISGSAQGFTHSLDYRFYFKDGYSYWQTGIGTGAATEGVLAVNLDNFIINSQTAHSVFNYWIAKNTRLSGGIAWEQNKNRADNRQQSRWIVDVGVGFRF
jgi:YaiO family outer membrane protein